MIDGPVRAFAEAFARSLEEEAATLVAESAKQDSSLIVNQYLLQATLLLRIAVACRKAAG